ncbi:MAG: twin-arginine translocation signal domain-containing protein, partial [Candidatus Poribacteria bacterium]|nr:twin-arginine translocation signal domain-containing protein [Candidatus Poribacteria bacterium]
MAEDKTRSTDQPEDRQTDLHQQVNETGLSRRNFLKGLGTGAVAATVAPATLAEADSHGAATSAEITRATAKLSINQQAYQIEVEPRTTL